MSDRRRGSGAREIGSGGGPVGHRVDNFGAVRAFLGDAGAFGGGFLGGLVIRSGRGGFDGTVDLIILFEQAEFALKSAFGGCFVAEREIVFLDLLRAPVVG